MASLHTGSLVHGQLKFQGKALFFSGNWKVYLMPQWTAGGKVDGNYGRSTIAVTTASKRPVGGAILFPVIQVTFANPDRPYVKYDYWSGQAIHQIMAKSSQDVSPDFGWSLFTDFIYKTYTDLLVKVGAGSLKFEDAMSLKQQTVVQYTRDQGFAVTVP